MKKFPVMATALCVARLWGQSADPKYVISSKQPLGCWFREPNNGNISAVVAKVPMTMYDVPLGKDGVYILSEGTRYYLRANGDVMDAKGNIATNKDQLLALKNELTKTCDNSPPVPMLQSGDPKPNRIQVLRFRIYDFFHHRKN